MRIEIVAALVALTVPLAAQPRGTVNDVTAAVSQAGSATVFTINGSNPCATVRVEYGDGNADVRTITGLPATVRHTYLKPGTYQVRALGRGNCIGNAATTVRVAAGAGGQQPGAIETRFREMDLNRDGVITRQEWRGSNQSFRVHDWNNDGVLSGAEIRVAARREREQPSDYTPTEYAIPDWSERTFKQLDANRDNRISRAEWAFDYEAFFRTDVNRDGFLSRTEFLSTDVDVDPDDRFEFLDLDGNGRISANEWHGTRAAFNALDRNRDGVLTRAEVAGQETVADDQFVSLDVNRDRSISVNEWYWSRASFDRLDVNRDGQLSRNEFLAAGPLGTSTTTSTPIVVSAVDRWTDTGIFVQTGDMITFNGTGTIRMSDAGDDLSDPSGSRKGRRATNAPLPQEPAGKLLARIGSSTPIPVGQTSSIRATRAGRLYLGVNDDHLLDNSGEYRVGVTINRGGGH